MWPPGFSDCVGNYAFIFVWHVQHFVACDDIHIIFQDDTMAVLVQHLAISPLTDLVSLYSAFNLFLFYFFSIIFFTSVLML